MRKPDCGIATAMLSQRHAAPLRSEDAKARLWDCNPRSRTTGMATFEMSEDAKARLWDCNY